MAQLGHLALLSALVISSCALPADLIGKWLGSPRLIRTGRDATIASLACLSIAGIALLILLLGSDSDAQNIATRSLRASYYGYEILKPWPGNAFSLLVWLWFQAGIVLMAFGKCREDHREFCANARVAGNLVSVFFLLALTVEINPFTIFDPHSQGGAAFDLLLCSPFLMAGYAMFAVPLVWSFAWLKWDSAQGPYPPLKHIHRDIVEAWLLLTVFEVLSAVMGALLMWRQAGFEGGWLRYVAPNISLVVWLPATALLCWSRLHKRDAVAARWIVPLSLITFSSCVLATFLGRPDMPAGARRLFIILLIHLWALAAVSLWRRHRRSKRSDGTREPRCGC
jgi:cytochrome c-type biogenesis protein CcmF